MFNNELYKVLEDRFGVERMRSFAEIMAVRHDLLFADSDDTLNGEDFERDWWLNKLAELNNLNDETLRIREDDQQRLQNLQDGQKQDLD